MINQIAGGSVRLTEVWVQPGENSAQAYGDITYRFILNQVGGVPFVQVGFAVWLEGTAYASTDLGIKTKHFEYPLFEYWAGDPSSSQLLLSFDTLDQTISLDFLAQLYFTNESAYPMWIEGGVYVGQFGQTASVVPLPSGLFLLGTGLLSLGAMVCRRRSG